MYCSLVTGPVIVPMLEQGEAMVAVAVDMQVVVMVVVVVEVEGDMVAEVVTVVEDMVVVVVVVGGVLVVFVVRWVTGPLSVPTRDEHRSRLQRFCHQTGDRQMVAASKHTTVM